MGRMLESLKRGEAPQAGGFATRIDKPHLPTTSADCAEEDLQEDEVPFIEIGGPGKLEASPAVLAAKPISPPFQGGAGGGKRPVQPPPPRAIPQELPPRETHSEPRHAPKLTEAKPPSVVYEPWPRPVTSARPIASEIIAYHQPDHPVSKQYADLLVKMLESVADNTSPVLLLCGSKTGVGTTTVLLNLAVCASRTNRRVAVVDTNLAHPALAERLGVDGIPGWNEILAGTAPLEQAIHSLANPKLNLLSSGKRSGETPSLKPDAVRWVVSWLRERFDLVLIDGPEASRAEMNALASNTDAIYLVVPDEQISASEMNALSQPITRHGGRVRGLIRTHYEP